MKIITDPKTKKQYVYDYSVGLKEAFSITFDRMERENRLQELNGHKHPLDPSFDNDLRDA